MLVQACLSVRKDLERCFYLSEGAVKLVQASLYAGKTL